jgi:PII-like signaling protein
MNGCSIRFYIHENHRHNNKLAHEWLLDNAKKLGAVNGSVFRAFAGFRCGDEHHQEHLMDSVMDMTIVVELILDVDNAERLIALVRRADLPVFVTRTPVEFETIF